MIASDGIGMKESDLYLPLKRFLESQNYEVKGEALLEPDLDTVRAVRDPAYHPVVQDLVGQPTGEGLGELVVAAEDAALVDLLVEA